MASTHDDGGLKADLDGVEGTLAEGGLADAIQLSMQARFSGCISVHSNGVTGSIFFHDGEIVHAEYPNKAGESALRDIISWSTGRYSVRANVTTTSNTIQKASKELFTEAFGSFRERVSRTPSQGLAAPKPVSTNSIIEKMRRVSGVVQAILQTKDGIRIGDDSFETEVLEGQASYLVMVANRLGEVFQLGESQFAAIQGSVQHLLVFSSKSHYLSVLVNADTKIGVVDAEIRKLLALGR